MNLPLDKLLPSYCVACNRAGEPICKSCIRNKIILNWDTRCLVCNAKVKLGFIHPECRESTYLDGHVFVVYYNEYIEKLVMNGKYSFVYSNFSFIGQMMSKFIKFYNFPNDMILAPVPLTIMKRNTRGFNQSEIIAKEICRASSFCCRNLLKKVRGMSSQAGLSGEERRINLKDSFEINLNKIEGISLNQKILLVDDVFTTGSTLNECARILKEFGFKEVIGFTFAKA